MLPYNTPILPVKRPDGLYKLVQDLRAINQIVQACHPVVPNPYTIFRKIPFEHKQFSVVDPKDASWTRPLDPKSRDLFAFEWENPTSRKKQQYHWSVTTRLHRGPELIWPESRKSTREVSTSFRDPVSTVHRQPPHIWGEERMSEITTNMLNQGGKDCVSPKINYNFQKS